MGSDGKYTASATFGDGVTFGNEALSYAEETLTSTDSTATSVTFTSPITVASGATVTITANAPDSGKHNLYNAC